MRIDPSDDMGNALAPLKIVACIPVHGRLPLLKHTITRLYQKNGVYKVICVGSENERGVCEQSGAIFINFQNKPLGRKWNEAFRAAEEFNPDACLFVGSSDFISDNWLDVLTRHMKYDIVGLPGCYFADVGETYRVVYWPGYTGKRENESIGIGRLIMRNALQRINWRPFDDNINSSLDYSMFRKLTNTHLLRTEECKALSISTNQWDNLHKFEMHWNNVLPSEKIDNPNKWLETHFPEVLRIF